MMVVFFSLFFTSKFNIVKELSSKFNEIIITAVSNEITLQHRNDLIIMRQFIVNYIFF